MTTAAIKPFLIAEDEQGEVRLTVRETRHNSQGYPWVMATLVEQTFATVAAARAYASEQFGAKPGEFARK
jgi:hypothetical protein